MTKEQYETLTEREKVFCDLLTHISKDLRRLADLMEQEIKP